MVKEIPYKDRDEWLLIRKDYIGGSDAGAVVGLNPYASPYSVWAEKTGKVASFEGNVTTRVGAYLEDLVAKMFEEETGKKVRRKNFTLVNDKYPWAAANVDRVVVGENSLLEIKTTNSLPNMRKFKNGEYPETWYCQMTHYMAVGEYNKAYLAVLIGSRDFKIFELDRDEDEIKALMKAESDFWECVKNDTPPAIDGTSATTDTIGELYDTEEEADMDLFGMDSHFERIDEIKGYIGELEEQKKSEENIIKEALKNASNGHSTSYKCSWRNQVRKSFDEKKFSKDFPQIDLSNYYKQSKSRVFRYSKI